MEKVITILFVFLAVSAQTALAGSITGTVTAEADSTPIQGLWVDAYHYQDYQYAGSGQTNNEGIYTITNLSTGTYRVVCWGSSLYAHRYYDNVYNQDYAAPVSVTGDGAADNIDFSLSLAGSITGTVRDVNGSPVTGIMINAHCDALNYGRSDYTGAGGVYELTGLPAGTYRVELATWDTSSGNYVKQYYDHTIYWDQAAPVHVLSGRQVTGIDFDLTEGASLSGYVRDPCGAGVPDTQVVSYMGYQWFTDTLTDANGFYKLRGLMAGITYKIAVYPPGSTDYMINQICTNIPDVNDYIAADINLQTGAVTVSGKVTDKTTSLPLAGIWVSCHLDDIGVWGGRSRTDANGIYTLTNLIAGGELGIWVEAPSQYARMGTEIELEYDINDVDFALPPAATLSGKVLDSVTAEPIADIMIEYYNGAHSCWISAFTDANGEFTITSLPEGIAEVMAQPPAATGYGWSLPWGSSLIWLAEGQNKSDRIIALHKGALVEGSVKYPDDSPAGHVEVCYEGLMAEGWLDTDSNGYYQIVLAPGKYAVSTDYDEDEFSSLPVYVTVTDPNQNIILPDIIAYDDNSGETISGTVASSIGSPAPGQFWITAIPTGTIVDPNTFCITTFGVSGCELDGPGPFEITALPPNAAYDICLFLGRENASEMESVALRDLVANVPPGSTAIGLSWDSAGGTIKGTVVNADGLPVLGATCLLNDAGTGIFGGFAEVNENGEYTIYNAAPGTYTATATHSRYLNASIAITVSEGATVVADTIVMGFTGDKEGPDLNGDGNVDMSDFAELAGRWMQTGSPDADFTLDGSVRFDDLTRLVENWLCKAIWYND